MNRKLPEQNRGLLAIIIVRVVVLPVWLYFAGRLGLLPDRLGGFPFLAFLNVVIVVLTALFLVQYRLGSNRKFQLYLQIATDLVVTTILVGHTNGIDSSFVSLYLLIIIYCSLTMGRSGGMVGAALSTILYAGTITLLELLRLNNPAMPVHQAEYKIAAHALGFWAVALLGAYLRKRLQFVEWELQEKIDSFTQLQRLNENVISSIRSGLITVDLSGRISVFNIMAGELIGRDPQEPLNQPIQNLLGTSLWNKILESNLLGSAKALRHEEWIDLPGGKKRFLGFSVSPLLSQNQELLGYIISFQDLTDIYRLEEEIRLKDKMAAVGSMAAGIAHEIRNPLTAISGSVEMLHSHANLPEKDKRLLNIILKESDRLNKFIEDFLNYARTGRCEKRPLDLVPLLKDSVTLLRNSPDIRDKHSVNLEINAASVPILGSEDGMHQVFWNLAHNAIRAMPGGGELKISISRNDVGAGLVVFQDNGVGMSRKEQERFFQPFHSGFEGGLGLGLSIIFRIMEDHGGKIAVESEKGQGAAFTLIFPVMKAAESRSLSEN